MTLSTVVISLFILILPLSNMAYDQNEKPELAGKYLGQTPPTLTPQIFAPGLVSIQGRYEMGVSFTTNLEEIYLSSQKEGDVAYIHYSQINNGVWQPIKK